MTSTEEISAVFQRHTEHRLQLDELVQFFPKILPSNPKLFDADKVEAIINFIKTVVNHETGSVIVSRQLVNVIVSRLEGNPIEGAVGEYGQRTDPIDPNLLKLVFVKLIGILQPRAISYEDQLFQVYFKLAGLYESERDQKHAAYYLKCINLEQAQRGVDDKEKIEIYMRTARLYLEGEESEEAEKMINRVSALIQNREKKEDDVTISYKALFARILDSRRRFIEAAAKFYELANHPLLIDADKRDALGNAITCVLLAPPGMARTRLLIQLYKDERSTGTRAFPLLEKTYLCRLIKTQEMVDFENSLLPHQKTNEAGEDIVKMVLVEHNVIAASRIYSSISLSSLATLLGLENDEAAEMVAAQMIADQRLEAEIDQIDGKIIFKEANPIKKWDDNIGSLCEQVSKVYDAIFSLHPEFVQQQERALSA